MKSERSTRPADQSGRTTAVRQVVIGDFLNVTWRMTVPTVLGLAAGYWLDRWLGSSPWLFMFGALLGLIAGIMLAGRIIRASQEDK